MNKIINMFGKMPRQVGFPNRFDVKTKKDMLGMINKNNGFRRCFVSVFNYTSDDLKNEKELMVDKIFFDLDSENCYKNTKKMHEKLIEKKIKHLILFSGKGFHIYVKTKDFEDLKNPKDTLYNATHFIAEKIGFTIGKPEKSDLDEHIVGDIARIATFPGTWNVKRRKFCIGISEEDLEKGYKFILEKANKQQKEFIFYGQKGFSLKKFDTEKPRDIMLKRFDEEIKIKIDKDKFLKTLPKCIAAMLTEEHLGYKKRGYIICYFRDQGNLMGETMQILKTYLSFPEFIHCCTKQMAPGHSTMGERQLQYFYKPYVINKTSFPSCKTLKKLGLCPLDKKDDNCVVYK